MKNYILIAISTVLQVPTCSGGEILMPYSAFGPQAMAYTLIGRASWQWEKVGDDDRNYPITVVVYWETTKEKISKKYPIEPALKKDFRYVELDVAIKYLKEKIADVAQEGEAEALLRLELKATLEKLEKLKPKNNE